MWTAGGERSVMAQQREPRGRRSQGRVLTNEPGAGRAVREEGQLIHAEGTDCAKAEGEHAPSPPLETAGTMAMKGAGAQRRERPASHSLL